MAVCPCVSSHHLPFLCVFKPRFSLLQGHSSYWIRAHPTGLILPVYLPETRHLSFLSPKHPLSPAGNSTLVHSIGELTFLRHASSFAANPAPSPTSSQTQGGLTNSEQTPVSLGSEGWKDLIPDFPELVAAPPPPPQRKAWNLILWTEEI